MQKKTCIRIVSLSIRPKTHLCFTIKPPKTQAKLCVLTVYIPCTVRLKLPHSEQDMGVRITITFIVECPVGTHPYIHKILSDVIPDTLYLLVPNFPRTSRTARHTRSVCISAPFRKARNGFTKDYCSSAQTPAPTYSCS